MLNKEKCGNYEDLEVWIAKITRKIWRV